MKKRLDNTWALIGSLIDRYHLRWRRKCGNVNMDCVLSDNELMLIFPKCDNGAVLM